MILIQDMQIYNIHKYILKEIVDKKTTAHVQIHNTSNHTNELHPHLPHLFF